MQCLQRSRSPLSQQRCVYQGMRTTSETLCKTLNLARFSIENELNINLGVNPFAHGFSHTVEAADGALYNMSRADERLAMFENCTYWASAVRAAIKAVSPQTLVGVGMFTYSAVGRAFASSKAASLHSIRWGSPPA